VKFESQGGKGRLKLYIGKLLERKDENLLGIVGTRKISLIITLVDMFHFSRAFQLVLTIEDTGYASFGWRVSYKHLEQHVSIMILSSITQISQN